MRKRKSKPKKKNVELLYKFLNKNNELVRDKDNTNKSKL